MEKVKPQKQGEVRSAAYQFSFETREPDHYSWRFLVRIDIAAFRSVHQPRGVSCDFSQASNAEEKNTWQETVRRRAIEVVRAMYQGYGALVFGDNTAFVEGGAPGLLEHHPVKEKGFTLFLLNKPLRVVPLPPNPVKSLHEYPFACVLAQAPHEQLYNTTKSCLHVCCLSDGSFGFADGLYASKSVTRSINGVIDWPVLGEALSMSVKAYSKSLMPKQDELRFQRVMLWQQFRHMSPPMAEDTEGHAFLALGAAAKWNGWLDTAAKAELNKRPQAWRFDEAVKDLASDEEWKRLVTEGKQFDAGERLRKFCEGIGLKRPIPTDFMTPARRLGDTLRIVLELHQGLRGTPTKQEGL